MEIILKKNNNIIFNKKKQTYKDFETILQNLKILKNKEKYNLFYKENSKFENICVSDIFD